MSDDASKIQKVREWREKWAGVDILLGGLRELDAILAEGAQCPFAVGDWFMFNGYSWNVTKFWNGLPCASSMGGEGTTFEMEVWPRMLPLPPPPSAESLRAAGKKIVRCGEVENGEGWVSDGSRYFYSGTDDTKPIPHPIYGTRRWIVTDTAPAYRQLTSREAFEQLGRDVIYKGYRYIAGNWWAGADTIALGRHHCASHLVSLEDCVNEVTFSDGSPFGKKEGAAE